MRAWHKEVIKDTIKAAVPGKQYLRQALRKIVPYKTDDGNDCTLFDNTVKQIEMLRSAGYDVRGRRVLEIGSGWHPISAMTFIAAGAESVTLTDIERLLDPRLIRSAINFVTARRDTLIERFGEVNIHRLNITDSSVPEMLGRLGLTYLVPYRTELSPDASADLITSSAVFEHIPTETLEKLTAEFLRILVPGGAMVHNIDCSDHYAMRDKSISRCNFLQYEDWVWRLCCINPQDFHNRLRHSDYAQMFKRHGFRMACEWRLTREKEQREVASIRLASRFVGRDIEDLAAVGSVFVLNAPGGPKWTPSGETVEPLAWAEFRPIRSLENP